LALDFVWRWAWGTSQLEAGCRPTASGAAAAGLISANVAALTEGVLKAMLLTKLKVAAAMLIGLTVVGVSASAVFGPGKAFSSRWAMNRSKS
jgi:hypothetical protein